MHTSSPGLDRCLFVNATNAVQTKDVDTRAVTYYAVLYTCCAILELRPMIQHATTCSLYNSLILLPEKSCTWRLSFASRATSD